MTEQTVPAAQEVELSELLQIRRDKLKNLQTEGRDPFTEIQYGGDVPVLR
jgi:hypothetical protein